MAITNLSTFDLQRKHLNTGLLALGSAILWVGLAGAGFSWPPAGVITATLLRNQPQGFTILAVAFFGYLLSPLAKKLYRTLGVRYAAVRHELKNRELTTVE